MKVIYAGFSKCGTKTMAAALRELGMTVYDVMECYEYQRDAWATIFREGGSTEDFRGMFEGVDAVTDQPSCFFWEEIHKAYPDAKIIFSERKSEDDWWRSFHNQMRSADSFFEKFLARLSPSYHVFGRWMHGMMTCVFNKFQADSLFRTTKWNEMRSRMTYRHHNSYVKQNAPKDKFLHFDLADGWEPLCRFLGLPEPTTPFPHKNKNANLKNELQSPVITRMRAEMAVSFVLFAATASWASWRIAKLLKQHGFGSLAL